MLFTINIFLYSTASLGCYWLWNDTCQASSARHPIAKCNEHEVAISLKICKIVLGSSRRRVFLAQENLDANPSSIADTATSLKNFSTNHQGAYEVNVHCSESNILMTNLHFYPVFTNFCGLYVDFLLLVLRTLFVRYVRTPPVTCICEFLYFCPPMNALFAPLSSPLPGLIIRAMSQGILTPV